jgi:hypothetical protein
MNCLIQHCHPEFIPGMTDWLNIPKLLNRNKDKYQQNKDENYIIIYIHRGKKYLIKLVPSNDFKKRPTLSYLGIKGNFLDLIKNISRTSRANILLNGEILKDIPKIGNETRVPP